MASSLIPYIYPKIHSAIQAGHFSSILITGAHTRDIPALISTTEKPGKPFNWQRPTATVLGNLEGDVLQLNVFPGRDYVQHYASLIGTYLALKKEATGKPNSKDVMARYMLPNEELCTQIFLESNLRWLGEVDVVILGYVDLLMKWTAERQWKSDSWWSSSGSLDSNSNNLFAWQKFKAKNGRHVAFLGCKTSYWGSISGHLVRVLQALSGVKVVLYVGKLGALSPVHTPNGVLATGNRSYLPSGQLVSWTNVLKEATQDSPSVVDGVHCTVSTSLEETKSWLEEWKDKADWVDPEIGHMALACVEGGIGFGYLHVVSDNLSMEGGEGLVDEKKGELLAARLRLLKEAEGVLEKFLGGAERSEV